MLARNFANGLQGQQLLWCKIAFKCDKHACQMDEDIDSTALHVVGPYIY